MYQETHRKMEEDIFQNVFVNFEDKVTLQINGKKWITKKQCCKIGSFLEVSTLHHVQEKKPPR